ncbi:IgGFc-binding protein [Pseudenhygromyxa sp. WMMC2535]|uniref:IgGFc-binding protein n=1 Tax=Pseudenhygromyxa sp. WMMC2535 TaxID=2712867 RepID=UPI00155538B0|nr:IgGFc-binding protein [Pseudenhygromyxa sp. WMMC2535]NVB38424.1 IgGFc-binding protein [Pseudenhygromyxa sp. WMMC2535]
MTRLHLDMLALASLQLSLASGCSVEVVDSLAGAQASLDGESLDAEALGDDLGEGSDERGQGEGRDEGDTDDEGPSVPLFDVGGSLPQISSCQFAAQFPSHLGCEFYGVDLDQPGLFDYDPYGFVVINPLEEPVEVELSRHSGLGWVPIAVISIPGEDEHVFMPQDNQVYGTGTFPAAVFRISSDQPVVAIQASPAVGEGHSSSATMLQPASAWTQHALVAGWRTHEGVGERSFLSVIGRNLGTPLTLGLSFGVEGLGDSDWVWAEDESSVQLSLDPGELARLDALAIDAEIDHGISGTTVESGQEHPLAVFSAHTCASIPDWDDSCGHMQEQLVSRFLGRRFVAPRMVSVIDPDVGVIFENTMVQVVAAEDDTEIRFIRDDDVELESVIIDPDEPYAVSQSSHDLAVIADKPILVSAYMTNGTLTGLGSASMVQLAPVEEWIGEHWVWVPAGYSSQLLITSSSAASLVVEQVDTLDALGGEPNPDPVDVGVPTTVVAEGLGSRELARVWVGPGIYRVRSGSPATVIVAGWRAGDGFAYLGGWGSLLTEPAG